MPTLPTLTPSLHPGSTHHPGRVQPLDAAALRRAGLGRASHRQVWQQKPLGSFPPARHIARAGLG